MITNFAESIQTIEAHKTSDGKIFEHRVEARKHQSSIDLTDGLKKLFDGQPNSHKDIITDGVWELSDAQKMELEKLLQNFRMTKACTS